MESYAVDISLGGLAVAALAWMWLLVCAFRTSAWWGLLGLILPPVALLFALRNSQKAIAPLVLFVLGGVVASGPVFYSVAAPIDVGMRDKLREGPKLWLLIVSGLRSDDAREWMETRAFYMHLGGAAVAVIAWIWLIVRAFRQHRRWGFGTLALPPVGVAFAARYPRKGFAPLGLFLFSLMVLSAPYLYIKFVPLDLGLRDKQDEQGNRVLTLNGWNRKDYSVLNFAHNVVVLQMANSDVTDKSLESIKGMKDLKELDLNGTQVTDAGLKILRDLPALTKLRLARTKITDKGFHETLFAKDSLMQLDLSGTEVSRDTVKAWRGAKSGRLALQ